MRETQNALQSPVSFLLFFCQLYLDLRNCKSVFLILKTSQYGGRGGEFNFFLGIYARIDIKFDIFISIGPMSQIWQSGTSTGFDPNDNNQAGAGDVITSRLRDKLKTYLHYQISYGHQIWQNVNLPSAPSYKITWSFDHVVLRDYVTNWNRYISTTAVPMATKLGTIVTYLNGSMPV